MSNIASVTKFFPTVNEGFTAVTTSAVTANPTNVPLSTVAGLVDGSVFVGIIDPTDAVKKQVFTGTVDSAGQRITGCTWTRGTSLAGHTSGATVVDYTTGTAINMISAGILKQHKQTGAHGAVTADSVTVAGATTSATISTPALTSTGTVTVPAKAISRQALATPIVGRFARSGDAVHTTNVWYINNMDVTIFNYGGYVLNGGGIQVPHAGIYRVTGQNGFMDIPTGTGLGEILVGWSTGTTGGTGGPYTYVRSAYIVNIKSLQQTRYFSVGAGETIYLWEHAGGTTVANYRLLAGQNGDSDSRSFLEIEYLGAV